MSSISAAARAAPPLEHSLQHLAVLGCHEGHFNVAAVLTPLAPGMADKAAGDPARWRLFLNVAPRRAVAELLHQLKISPEDVEIVPGAGGADVACTLATADPGASRPLVFIWELPAEAAATALAELARGIKP